MFCRLTWRSSAVLISGAFIATLTARAATVAMIGVGLANLMGFLLLRRGLWRYEPWNTQTTEHIMGKIAAAGAWAIVGSGIHWLLIQGYSYLVAGVLNISDVASIAATRLTLMPVFVLSGGVSMLLFPMTSRWVHDLGTRAASRRLLLAGCGARRGGVDLHGGHVGAARLDIHSQFSRNNSRIAIPCCCCGVLCSS